MIVRADAKLGSGLFDGLIVDLFAGGGGASVAIEQAEGRAVDIAINHDPEAIALHRINHPHTFHFEANVRELKPRDVVGPRHVRRLHASPDCKDFSKAKGGKPVSRRVRSLANVVIWWARDVRPDEITLENVEEFKEWGPLIQKVDKHGEPVWNKDGTPFMVRDPRRKGQYFRRWVRKLEKLGYRVEWRELRACDYGAPTIRKRLFVVARSDGREITWPEATHGEGYRDANSTSGSRRRRGERSSKGLRDSLAEASGHQPHGAGDDNAECGRTRGIRGGGGVQLKPYRTAAECIDFSKPVRSIFGRKRRLKPNTERRIAKGVLKYVIQKKRPFIVTCNHSGPDFRGQSIDEPMRTVTGSRDAHGIVAPTLIQTGYGERKGQSPRVPGLDKPLGTVVAGGVKHAAVAASLIGAGGAEGSARPRPVDEPMNTTLPNDRQAVVAALLTKLRGTSKHGQAIDAPAPTVTAGGKHEGLTAALLTKHYGGVIGHEVDRPAGTITTTDHHSLAVANLIKFYGNEKEGVSVTEPMHTVTTKDRMGLVESVLSGAGGFSDEAIAGFLRVCEFLVEYLGPDAPLPVVELDGEIYLITDIGMRMLMPRELYAAQGFPPSYVIEFTLSNGRRLSQAAQVRMCGNSVSPPPLCALIRANGTPGRPMEVAA